MAEGILPAEAMDTLADGFQGRVGFYFKDLTTGEVHQYDADRPSPIASICKVPVMIELFKQVDQGRLSLDERRRLPRGISKHGTGVLGMLEDEPELTLRDFCRLMIYVSDNMATDVLMDVVGLDAVNATMEDLGFHQTRTKMTMGRWHYSMAGMGDCPPNDENDDAFRGKRLDDDSLPFQDSLENNVASARDMGVILEKLHNGQIVSPEASDEMIKLLKGCTSNTKIPLHLKRGIPVAHKIGSSGRIKGDAGIVYLPERPLVITVLAVGDESDAAGNDLIAELSRLAFRALSPESLEAGA